MLEFDYKLGDIILFKGKGLTFETLSRIIKIYEKDWDRWGWHMSFISSKDSTFGPMICEMRADGLNFTPLYKYDDGSQYRVYRWLNNEPTQEQMSEWVRRNVQVKYDVEQYLWSAVSYLVRHYFNRPIPRLLNFKWTCWEAVFALMYEVREPIPSKYDCEMITDFLKEAEDFLVHEHAGK